MQVEAIQCASCGAPLDIGSSRSVTCSYCGRTMRLHGGEAELEGPAGPARASDVLLMGYRADVGDGRRYDVREMAARDWKARERGVWPIAARASTSFGAGWGPVEILGRPRVYPRHGDRRGAWAPRARTSHVEWIEADYPAGVGKVSALRVFETHMVGSAFAVTVAGDDDEEDVVWQRRSEALTAGARVLEVPLEPPRVVRTARVYITNSGNSWAEIDTIGLLATDPVPPAIRKKFRRPRSYGLWIAAVLIVAVAGGFLWLGSRAGRQAKEPTATVAEPAVVLTDSRAAAWTPSADELAAAPIVWATRAAGASSQYGAHQWAPKQAAGAPNTYPVHADKPTAWATRDRNGGGEWIELAWEPGVRAGAVVVVETFNPGAVARVDDLSAAEPVALWRGTSLHDGAARALVIELPEPRTITRLRLVLDTRRALGWNEIDAVGLRPPR